MNWFKPSTFSTCLSAVLVIGTAIIGGHIAEAAPKKAKTIANVLKTRGLLSAPSATDAIRGKKKRGAVVALGAAPTLEDMLQNQDLDQLFWDGALSKILAEDSSGCDSFFDGHLACGLNNDMIMAVTEAGRAGVTNCYLKTMVNLESGVTHESAKNIPLTDAFDPPAGSEDSVVRINMIGFPGEDEGQQSIVARVTAADNLGSKAYEITLNFCSVPDGESGGGNLLQIFKNGTYIAKDLGSEGERQYSFSFRSKVKVSANGKSVEFDPNAKTTMSMGSTGGSFNFNKLVVLENGKVTIRSNERYGESENEYRRAIVRLLISGAGKNVRLTSGAAKMDDAGREMQGGVSWSSSENRFQLSDSNSILNGIENEDLEGEFYTEEGQLDGEIDNLPDCNLPDEDLSAEINLDFGDPAAQEMAAKCEPLRLQGGGLCNDNEQVGQASGMYAAVCQEGGGGPGEAGPGPGPGEGEGPGPGEGV
jgi:hypothetical protein